MEDLDGLEPERLDAVEDPLAGAEKNRHDVERELVEDPGDRARSWLRRPYGGTPICNRAFVPSLSVCQTIKTGDTAAGPLPARASLGPR
jgi:hypothetical protein